MKPLLEYRTLAHQTLHSPLSTLHSPLAAQLPSPISHCPSPELQIQMVSGLWSLVAGVSGVLSPSINSHLPHLCPMSLPHLSATFPMHGW